jgi:D-lactate dehydrogenase
MKIAFFECEKWEKDFVKVELKDHEVDFFDEPLTEDSIFQKNDYEAISIFINSRINEKTISFFPNLKFVTTRSTGFDHIDVDACKSHNIITSYVPGYGDNTVAEFAFGLILNLTRKIYQAVDRVKEYGNFSLDGLRGIDIKGKTIGIIGTGRIGRETISIANGFGMNILAYDVFPNVSLETQFNFKYVSLDDLLKNSDVISLHCPLTKETFHLINSSNIQYIKPGAYIINTARGGLIETKALVEAIHNNILAGAAIDVFEEESGTENEFGLINSGKVSEQTISTILENDILMKMQNVLITPHNAFNSKEALTRILQITLQNIQGFLSNNPINLIP